MRFFATFLFRLRKKQTNFKLQKTVWKRQRLKAGCNNYLRGTRNATNYGLWVSACGKDPLDDSKEPQLRRVPFVRFFWWMRTSKWSQSRWKNGNVFLRTFATTHGKRSMWVAHQSCGSSELCSIQLCVETAVFLVTTAGNIVARYQSKTACHYLKRRQTLVPPFCVNGYSFSPIPDFRLLSERILSSGPLLSVSSCGFASFLAVGLVVTAWMKLTP